MTEPTGFLSLLRDSRVAGIIGAVSIGRLAAGMVPFGMIAIYTSKNELGWAGGSFAAFLIGAAVAGPHKGALVDRFGARRMLVPMAVAFAVVATAAALLAQHGGVGAYAAALVLTASAAILAPPNSAVLRSVWTEVAGPDAGKNTRLHALDSVVEEATFVVAPLLTSGIWLVVGAQWAVIAGGLCALVGTVWFRGLIHRIGAHRVSTGSRPPGDRPRQRTIGVLLSRNGAALLVPMIAVGLAMGALSVGYPAWALRHANAELAGVLVALDSVGGILAGIVYGHLSSRRPGPWVRYFTGILILCTGVLVVAVSQTIPVVVIGSFLVGAALTPMYIVAYTLVGAAFPDDRHTAVNAAIGSSYNLGSGVAALAAGAALGIWSLPATLIVVALATLALGAIALLGRSTSAPAPAPAGAGPAPPAEADVL
ncbi:MFS transporter [Paractinoplanes maris]|uniref:MFS transporter n=1 Tax=Paractinoplanes maris TaxID=1734446 RepID=UPI00201FB89F|nr:MFS transporter [Actinoplanes maris]